LHHLTVNWEPTQGIGVLTKADAVYLMFRSRRWQHEYGPTITQRIPIAWTPCTLGGSRPLPLGERKAKLARLLARAPAGIVHNEHTEEDGAVVFRHACKLGFEGIVSKRLTAPYRSGPSRDWVKVKNPDSPAMRRARAGQW
jgi:hypothetical protein